MKKKIFIYLSGIALLMTTLNGCHENETPVFDTGYTALNIWFGTVSLVLDSTSYNYSYTLGEDSLMFNARVTGLPTQHDRTFTLEVYSGDISEAEGSYRTCIYCIPSGEVSVQLPIYFDTSKLKNSKSFMEKNGSLCFRMVENSEFAAGVNNMQALRVVLKNYLAKPAEWDAAAPPMTKYSTYFGAYGRVKYSFMIQVTGLVDFHIASNASVPYNAETNTMSTTYASYLLARLKQALEDYNNIHGTLTENDENHTPVVF